MALKIHPAEHPTDLAAHDSLLPGVLLTLEIVTMIIGAAAIGFSMGYSESTSNHENEEYRKRTGMSGNC